MKGLGKLNVDIFGRNNSLFICFDNNKAKLTQTTCKLAGSDLTSGTFGVKGFQNYDLPGTNWEEKISLVCLSVPHL